jgi:hypothetical protein
LILSQNIAFRRIDKVGIGILFGLEDDPIYRKVTKESQNEQKAKKFSYKTLDTPSLWPFNNRKVTVNPEGIKKIFLFEETTLLYLLARRSEDKKNMDNEKTWAPSASW